MGKPKKKRPHTGRDYHMVGIIKGANKAYVEKDQKKEANKRASRSKVNSSEIEYISPMALNCLQCDFGFIPGAETDDEEIAAQECGFCSASCMDYYESQE